MNYNQGLNTIQSMNQAAPLPQAQSIPHRMFLYEDGPNVTGENALRQRKLRELNDSFARPHEHARLV